MQDFKTYMCLLMLVAISMAGISQTATIVDHMGSSTLSDQSYQAGSTFNTKLWTHLKNRHFIGGYNGYQAGPHVAASTGMAGSRVDLLPFGNYPGFNLVKGMFPHDSTHAIFTVPSSSTNLAMISDGTLNGTQILDSIGGGEPHLLLQKDGKTLLWTQSQYLQLWVTDGTPAGSQVLWNSFFFSFPPEGPFFIDGSNDYFFNFNYSLTNGNDGLVYTSYLLRLSEDLSSVSFVESIGKRLRKPFNWYPHQGKAYMYSDSAHNLVTSEAAMLYVTDGTPNGTLVLKSVPDGSCAYPFAFSDSTDLFFYVYENGSGSIWTTDGTPGNTQLAFSLGNVYVEEPIQVHQGKAYLVVGNQIWETDGTGQGTQLVATNGNGNLTHVHRMDGDTALYFFDDQGLVKYVPGAANTVPVFACMNPNFEFRRVDAQPGYNLYAIYEGNESNYYLSNGDPNDSGLLAQNSNGVYKWPAEGFYQIPGSGTAYLFAYSRSNFHSQIWKTNGTLSGSSLIFSQPCSQLWQEIHVQDDHFIVSTGQSLYQVDTLGNSLPLATIQDHFFGLGNWPGDSISYCYSLGDLGELDLWGIGNGLVTATARPTPDNWVHLRNNPGARLELHIEGEQEGLVYAVYGLDGRQLVQASSPAALAQRSETLARGVYLVRVAGPTQSWTGKWLKTE